LFWLADSTKRCEKSEEGAYRVRRRRERTQCTRNQMGRRGGKYIDLVLAEKK